MNRIEIISNFTAMRALLKNKLYSELEEVIEETLAAAKGENVKKKTESENNHDG
jgi:hypothetical protein